MIGPICDVTFYTNYNDLFYQYSLFFLKHRCGALFEGDRVESIDDICVENIKLQEAMYRLKNNGLNVIRLQIVPNAIMNSDKSIQNNSGNELNLLIF